MPDTVTALVVGGYTAEGGGTAPGLRVLVPDASSSGVRELESLDLPSPSYLASHPIRPLLLVSTETAPSRLASFDVGADGRLRSVSQVTVPGDFACHVAVSPSADLAVVACYGSGSVASFQLEHDGRLSPARDEIRFFGSGPDAQRQDAPHAHQAVFDGSELLICDLGTDQVHRLYVDSRGRFRADDPLRLPPGTGPRHCLVVGDHLFVVGELSGTMWLGGRRTDGWSELQQLPTSATAPDIPVQPSAVVTDGARVFVANRGPDTIAMFEFVGDELTRTAEFPCGGTWPRDLTVAAGLLWAANERSNTITAFALDDLPGSGPVLTVPTPSPTRVVVLTSTDR